MKYLTKKYSKKDIAAATQYTLEKVVINCVKNLSRKKINLALAGGVFANVKLNQKIKDLKNIKDIFVFIVARDKQKILKVTSLQLMVFCCSSFRR